MLFLFFHSMLFMFVLFRFKRFVPRHGGGRALFSLAVHVSEAFKHFFVYFFIFFSRREEKGNEQIRENLNHK